MKRYIKSANKLTNFLTQQIARKFDSDEIFYRAFYSFHDGSPMLYVFLNLMLDEHVTLGNQSRNKNRFELLYDGKNIGWIDFDTGMGWVDDRAYDKVKKQDSALLEQLATQIFYGPDDDEGDYYEGLEYEDYPDGDDEY